MSRFIMQPARGLSTGNYILKAEDFFISYNPNPGGMISSFAGDDGSVETAIVKGENYYILNGDFREEYEALVDEGFDVCYNFFLSKPELKSSWSN